jgi:predicted nucleic acid-binding Zn ribbon protein
MIALSTLFARALRQLPPNQGLQEGWAFATWKQVVGEGLGKRTRPFRLHKKTLIVAVPSPVWQRELRQMEKEVLGKLQRVMGQGIVHALEFRVDPNFDCEEGLPPESAPSSQEPAVVELPLEKIQDPELSRAMAAAASSYLNRQNHR